MPPEKKGPRKRNTLKKSPRAKATAPKAAEPRAARSGSRKVVHETAVKATSASRAASAPRAAPDATAKVVRAAGSASGRERMDPAVDALLDDLAPPNRTDLDFVRRSIVGASPAIREAVKWNAPSFRTSEFFATVHLRSRDGVAVVLHTGAKVKASASSGLAIADPSGLLKWLAKDRALVTLGDARGIAAKRAAFQKLLRAWIEHV